MVELRQAPVYETELPGKEETKMREESNERIGKKLEYLAFLVVNHDVVRLYVSVHYAFGVAEV